MPGKRSIDIIAALMLAAGVLAAALVARLGNHADWALAAPVLLALTVVLTDVTVSRLRGGPLWPGPASLFLASSFLIAGFMVGLHDPAAMSNIIPVLGAACGAPLVLGRRRGPPDCRPHATSDSVK